MLMVSAPPFRFMRRQEDLQEDLAGSRPSAIPFVVIGAAALNSTAVLLCALRQSVGTLVDLVAFCGIRSATECIRCSVASSTSARFSSWRPRSSEDTSDM